MTLPPDEDAPDGTAPGAGTELQPEPDPQPEPRPEPKPDPDPEPQPKPDPKPRRGVRIAMLAIAGAAAAIGGAIAIMHSRREPVAPSIAVKLDGGAAIHAVEPPHVPVAPAGSVHLTGVVVDGAGAPVAGAEVSAELEHGEVDRALVRPTGDAGVAIAADAGAAAATSAIVGLPTGPEGRFVLDGLVPGRYRLRVTGAGLLAAEVRFVPVPSDETRIVVARQIAIDGVVTDTGKPVANAQVGIRGDAIGGTLELRTDAAGKFHVGNLAEGRYQVWAWQAALAARTVRVAHLGAGPFPPLELQLEAGAIVVGRVLDRDEGTGLVAAIELRPAGDDQAPRYARSGDDGVFRIEGVPAGRWIADAFAPGYGTAGGVELEAGHGIPELSLVRGGAIEGRVLDGDGQPVAGATVRALGETAAGDTTAAPVEISEQVELDKLRRFSGRTAAPADPNSTAALGDADPRFVARGELGVLTGPIPPIPPPGTPPGRQAVVEASAATSASMLGEPAPLATDPARASIWITGVDGRYRIRGVAHGKVGVLAVAPGFAEARSKPTTLVAGELQANVDIVVTPGTFVVGTVTDQHGAPVVGAELHAQPAIGAAVDGVSAADGTYRLGPITGAITLHASAYGHGDASRAIELAPVRGRTPGEQHEDLVLVIADAVLAGTLDDVLGVPVAAARVTIVGGAGDGRVAVVATDGTFSIDLLPAGTLHLRIDHPDYPPYETDVDTTAHARIRLPLGGAIEGALVDAVSGDPIAGVAIAAVGPNNVISESSTEKSGRWKLGPLHPGHWKVTVTLPGYLTTVRELDVPASTAPGLISVRDVRIDLPRGALVGGTVRDASGHRVAGAHLLVHRSDGTGVAVEADSDADGEFRIRDCPTGELEIVATHGDARGTATATIRGGEEVLTLAIALQ